MFVVVIVCQLLLGEKLQLIEVDLMILNICNTISAVYATKRNMPCVHVLPSFN